MASDRTGIPTPREFQELLGYLNFSSGSSDPQFLRNLNAVFAAQAPRAGTPQATWQAVGRLLQERLQDLAASEAAFHDVEQAGSVLRLAFEVVPERYREFHRDLLFHQPADDLFRPFFMGRVCESVLEQSGPWDETERIVSGAIARLNDYVGYRPVAVLRTAQRIEPYPREWIRPIPLFVRGAGVAAGRYREVIEMALDILRTTDAAILREACFDPELLDELSLDPRAYDFDHPVNKRPNYHFGQWDQNHIDPRGRYRRFVVQQVTLDVLLERVEQHGELAREEVLAEAAAVLAGTILMASGTSGNGPDAHDSATTLSTLLPRIAAYRDAFYEQFIERLSGEHGARLRAESVAGKQPLAGARQHLNQQLARRRAAQLEHVHLALLFARMGYPEAALRQAQVVPVAAARMACEIQCRLTTGHLAIDRGELPRASTMLLEIEDYLHRAIECGALVDPWNILGFQGQFSLFPAPENSVPDHRLEQLIELMEQIFSLYARLWSEAAACDDQPLQAALAGHMDELARWWDQFAPTSVESIEAFSGAEAYDSAREVAKALAAFRQAGAAAGDIAFWRTRVAEFNSPKAYALVVGALLQKPDPTAAMALLMQWLSQAGQIPLRQGEYSFYALAQRWLADASAGGREDAGRSPERRQAMVVKFFELLEANAEDYWQVPSLDLFSTSDADELDHADDLDDIDSDDADLNDADLDDEEDEEDEEDGDDEDDESNPYGAAYDDVVYIDSTGDGVEADMLESGAATDFELEQEARRVGERLALLRSVASLWKHAVLALEPTSAAPLPDETLRSWLDQADEKERQLLALLRSVSQRRVVAASSSRDSLLEFDRRRTIKESLVEKIVATLIETSDAARSMRAALPAPQGDAASDDCVDDVLRAVVRQDRAAVGPLWPRFLDLLKTRTLLYQSPVKGGDPARLVQARTLQQLLRDLLGWLPRLGLIKETCQLLEAARLMESSNPVGPGAISEYDRLFSAGYEALVEAIVTMSADWPGALDPQRADDDLIECLEHLTESLLKQWLAHSRTLRLSVLERIADDKQWQSLQKFIKRYGGDLFTQHFLNMGNLRAILHQGIDVWLERLADEGRQSGEYEFRLLQDVDEKISGGEVVMHLSLVIEAILENYAEYRDYNSTTTQSDRGEMLYTLLDFLRLRVQYDRVAWHLKPVLIAHEVLVRHGRSAAAEMWRRALVERTGELADTLQNRGAALRKKYAMRLPTVTDRLAERFVRPLVIDRVRALVKPAMEAVRSGTGAASESPFQLLEQETAQLTQEPTGVGLEVPTWLASLEQEVAERWHALSHLDRPQRAGPPLEQFRLTLEDVEQQLTDWENNPLD